MNFNIKLSDTEITSLVNFIEHWNIVARSLQDVEQAVVEDSEAEASNDGLPIISILVGTALVFAIGTSWYFAIKRRNLI